jgi:outer membrane protein assembly factor BamB
VIYTNGDLEIVGGSQAYPTLPQLPAQPKGVVIRNDVAAITLTDGQVVLLSCASGNILWTARSGISPEESGEQGNEIAMLYDERGIYMLSKSGAAGFTENGQRLWFIRIIGAAALPIFSEEGLLYSGGIDWTLYAYRLENRILPQQQSLYGPLPDGNYGLDALRPTRHSDYNNRFNEGEVRSRLSRINRAIREGQVGEEETNFTAYLMEVAGSVRNSLRVSLSHPPVQIRERAEAVRLLSHLGSQEIIPFLADLFMYDPEPLVKVAIAEGIGRIGIDRNGLAMEAFSLGVLSPAQIKDEQVLKAVAAAVGSLCRFSGPPLSGMGVKILIALAGSDKPLAVRIRAIDEIKTLRQ